MSLKARIAKLEKSPRIVRRCTACGSDLNKPEKIHATVYQTDVGGKRIAVIPGTCTPLDTPLKAAAPKCPKCGRGGRKAVTLNLGSKPLTPCDLTDAEIERMLDA